MVGDLKKETVLLPENSLTSTQQECLEGSICSHCLNEQGSAGSC